jgi:CBS domain-containing protein
MHARVADAMRPGVIGVEPDTSLREIARILASKHIHCVVVSSEGKLGAPRSWAMISALDLLSPAVNGDLEDRTAIDIAPHEPTTIGSDARLEHAARVMAEKRLEHLLVIDASDAQPVGILSTLDIAGVVAWGEA